MNEKMNKKEGKYWYEQLDRFGLLFAGMFLGALMELTEIKTLGIIISVVGVTCTAILMFTISKFVLESKEVGE